MLQTKPVDPIDRKAVEEKQIGLHSESTFLHSRYSVRKLAYSCVGLSLSLSLSVAYGGVALVWRRSRGLFKQVDFKNPDNFEVVAAAGSLRGHSRKFVVVACYIPPGYTRQRGQAALDYIENVVIQVKRKYQDPFVAVAGDFNQWKLEDCLANFADINETKVGNTRGSKAIDRFFTNMSRSVVEAGTLEPLETEGEGDNLRKSDHRVGFCKINLPRKQAFKWVTYSYRHFNDNSAAKFRDWIVMYDWAAVLQAPSSDAKAEEYQGIVVKAVERFFPLRTVRKKDNDPPWMDKKTKDMIEARKRFYMDEGGRTAAWKEEKRITNEAVRKRKRGFLDIQREKLLSSEASRNFYRQVRSFGAAERPRLFDVRDLMPEGQSDELTAENLAEYFNRVSNEFEPLRPNEIPCTREKELPILHEYEVAGRIRRFKKPRSTVPGDIFPQLVTQFADFLAVPLANIYNCITVTRKWPRCWKREYVTVIPKNSSPQSLSDLRNISCTLLASKMYESYVLDWLKQEVHLRSNQYGGVKGLSTDHLLVGLWQQAVSYTHLTLPTTPYV